MKIEIKLDDPERCHGCPCFVPKTGGGWGPYKIWGKKCYKNIGYWVSNLDLDKYVRPQECIEKHGKEWKNTSLFFALIKE